MLYPQPFARDLWTESTHHEIVPKPWKLKKQEVSLFVDFDPLEATTVGHRGLKNPGPSIFEDFDPLEASTVGRRSLTSSRPSLFEDFEPARFGRPFANQKRNYTHFLVPLGRFWVAIGRVLFAGDFMPGRAEILSPPKSGGLRRFWGPKQQSIDHKLPTC